MAPKFDAKKFTVDLKTCKIRTDVIMQRKNALAQQIRREIATLISDGKLESARIKSEQVIRYELEAQAFELLIQLLDTVVARQHILLDEPKVPNNLLEAVSTIIWAASYCEVKEFPLLRNHFLAKYGKTFIADASSNAMSTVNPRVMAKLSIGSPAPQDIIDKLHEICVQYQIEMPADLAVEYNQLQEMRAQSHVVPVIQMPQPLPREAVSGSGATSPLPPPAQPPQMPPSNDNFGDCADLLAQLDKLNE